MKDQSQVMIKVSVWYVVSIDLHNILIIWYIISMNSANQLGKVAIGGAYWYGNRLSAVTIYCEVTFILVSAVHIIISLRIPEHVLLLWYGYYQLLV